jgi:hypothetical protein
MLRSIQLENFKAFGQRTIIPLAPITLIFGQNSAGKSSILQALGLLKQTRQQGDLDAVLLPRVENGLVDLGSFQEMVFDHDLSRELSIRLDMDWQNIGHRTIWGNRIRSKLKGLGVRWDFARRSLSEDVRLVRMHVYEADTDEALAEFDHIGNAPLQLRRRPTFYVKNERPIKSRYLGRARCISISKNSKYWLKTFESIKDNIGTVNKTLRRGKAEVEKRLAAQPSPQSEDSEETTFQAPWDEVLSRFEATEALDEAIRFYESDFTLEPFIERVARSRVGAVMTLDGIIPIPLRLDMENQEHQEVPTAEEYLFTVLEVPTADDGNEIIEYGISPWYFAKQAGDHVEEVLRNVFPLGPFRKAPERYYIFTGTNPNDVGHRGHLLPDLLFRNPRLVTDTNEWLERLDIGYRVELRPLGPTVKDLFEIRLTDVRRSSPVDVGLLDVGFGISQILPFVVQSLAARNQIITIEQPEVHIHPRLQADLGDLLIEAIKEPRCNQFIIETHSEHLALRLQRRVREKKLPPKDISVVYISRGPAGATVQPLRLDEEGDFIDDFPGGFFPERLRELR